MLERCVHLRVRAGGEGVWEGLTDRAGHRCGCAGWRARRGALRSLADAAF